LGIVVDERCRILSLLVIISLCQIAEAMQPLHFEFASSLLARLRFILEKFDVFLAKYVIR